LKCTSEYPAPVERANLLTIPDMIKRLNVPIGISDHTLGITLPIVAVTLGATIVEKHFILDRNLGGPDSAFSLEPADFSQMVKAIREAELSLGVVDYELSEKDKLRRRSLFAIKDIAKGEILSSENVRSIRPGLGLAPEYFEQILGKTASENIKKGTPLSWNLI
jgi:pseudaminic acid synthase